jgi:hypothetical protein
MYGIQVSSGHSHQLLDKVPLLFSQHHDNWGNSLRAFDFLGLANGGNLICELHDLR